MIEMKHKLFIFILCSILVLLVACQEYVDPTTTQTTGTTEEPLPDIPPSPDMCDHIPDMGDYRIVWCDEFNYRGLPDPTKWDYDVGGHGWGNNELQYYRRASRSNVMVQDDNLIITARKENYENRNYTSTRLLSAGKFQFTYGYIEFRAKLPAVKGTWPALWMLGDYWKYGWPECGEIDVMEHVAQDLNVIHGSIHTTDYNHVQGTQKTASIVLDDVTNQYNLYAVEWTPKQIRFFVNGINYFTFNNDEINNPNHSRTSWPFDEEMFIIMNVAIGGWGGTPDPNFTEAKMYVDYVRVYQKDYPTEDEDVTPPTAIENLTVKSIEGTRVNLAWDAAWDDLGVKYYEIYAQELSPNANRELIGITTIPSYTLTNLKQNTSYSITVYAVDFSDNYGEGQTIEVQTGSYPTIPTRIEAEDYIDMFGIDLETTQDVGGGLNVGWMDAGDYLVYYITVLESGYYTLNYRIAANQDGAQYELYLNDDEIPLVITDIPYTGGWQNWRTVQTEAFYLEEGTHRLLLKITAPGSNLNWFEFVSQKQK